MSSKHWMRIAWLSAAVAAGLALVACGNGGGSGTQPASTTNAAPEKAPPPEKVVAPAPPAAAGLPQLTDTMPPAVSPSRPPAKAWDEPASDYQSLLAVKTAGPAAVGKLVAIKAYQIRLAPPDATEIQTQLYECAPAEGDEMPIEVRYDPALRDSLRGLPNGSKCDTPCGRVLVKIAGFDSWQTPQGELLAVYDAQPDPPPAKLPAGVDYVAMDDALLDGPAALGKVLDVGVYMGTKTETDQGNMWTLFTQNCGTHGGYNAELHLYENADNAAFIKGLPFDAGTTCQRVRVKLTKGPTVPFPKAFVVDLVGVGPQFKRFFPDTCP